MKIFKLSRAKTKPAVKDFLASLDGPEVEPEVPVDLSWEQQNKKNMHCREELLKQVRQRPELVEQMGFLQNPSNLEILRCFKGVRDPLDFLRKLGLEADDASDLSELVDGALLAVPPDPPCMCLKRPGGKCLAFSGALIPAILVCSSVPFYLLAKSTEGWLEGVCNIMEYHLKSCTGGTCTFDIEIREADQASLKTYAFYDWRLPVAEDIRNSPRVIITAEAFRCCNPDYDLNCCNMYDEPSLSFCDNVPHLDDPNGQPCPAGDWPCLFKLGMGSDGYEVATTVIAYEPPDVLGFMIAGVTFVLISCSAAVYGFCARNRFSGLRRMRSRCFRKKVVKQKGTQDEESPKELKESRPQSKSNDPKISDTLTQQVDTPSPDVRADNISSQQPDAQSQIKSPDPPQEISSEQEGETSTTHADTAPDSPSSEKRFRNRRKEEKGVSKAAGRSDRRDTNLAYTFGDLSSFSSAVSKNAAITPIIEPLPAAVAARRQSEIRRQNNVRAPRARPTSAPAMTRAAGRSEFSAAAWTFAYAEEQGNNIGGRSHRPVSAPNARQQHTSFRQPRAADKRPASGIESVTTAATSRQPKSSALSNRPESSKWSDPSPMSNQAFSNRPESSKWSDPSPMSNQCSVPYVSIPNQDAFRESALSSEQGGHSSHWPSGPDLPNQPARSKWSDAVPMSSQYTLPYVSIPNQDAFTQSASASKQVGQSLQREPNSEVANRSESSESYCSIVQASHRSHARPKSAVSNRSGSSKSVNTPPMSNQYSVPYVGIPNQDDFMRLALDSGQAGQGFHGRPKSAVPNRSGSSEWTNTPPMSLRARPKSAVPNRSESTEWTNTPPMSNRPSGQSSHARPKSAVSNLSGSSSTNTPPMANQYSVPYVSIPHQDVFRGTALASGQVGQSIPGRPKSAVPNRPLPSELADMPPMPD